MKWTRTAPVPKPEEERESHGIADSQAGAERTRAASDSPSVNQTADSSPDPASAAAPSVAAPSPAAPAEAPPEPEPALAVDRTAGSCHTNLAPPEIRTRLLDALDTGFISRSINMVGFSFARKPYVGQVGRRRFRIETRNGFGSHGGALVLYGSLHPVDHGTHVRWRFGLHPFLRLSAGIWFLAAAVVFVVNLLRAILTRGMTWGFRAGHVMMAVIGPSLMVIAGLVFIRYCLYSERAKKQVLMELLLGMCGEK